MVFSNALMYCESSGPAESNYIQEGKMGDMAGNAVLLLQRESKPWWLVVVGKREVRALLLPSYPKPPYAKVGTESSFAKDLEGIVVMARNLQSCERAHSVKRERRLGE